MKKLKDTILNFEFFNTDNNFIDIEDLDSNTQKIPDINDDLSTKTIPQLPSEVEFRNRSNDQQDIDILSLLHKDNLDFSLKLFNDLNFYYKNNIVLAKDERD